MRKFKFTDQTTEYRETPDRPTRTLHRIEACYTFTTAYGLHKVSKGDIGGWVESETNLDQFDDSWIMDNSAAMGTSYVRGSLLCENAVVETGWEILDGSVIQGGSKLKRVLNGRVVNSTIGSTEVIALRYDVEPIFICKSMLEGSRIIEGTLHNTSVRNSTIKQSEFFNANVINSSLIQVGSFQRCSLVDVRVVGHDKILVFPMPKQSYERSLTWISDTDVWIPYLISEWSPKKYWKGREILEWAKQSDENSAKHGRDALAYEYVQLCMEHAKNYEEIINEIWRVNKACQK